MPSSSTVRLLVFSSAVLASACGTPAATCITGASALCACPNGSMGAQVCQADGTFGTCTCLSPVDAGSGGGPDAGAADAGTTDAGVDAGVDAGRPVFVTFIPAVESIWSTLSAANGALGYDAGVNACRSLGADHPCEYQEVLRAEARGEFARLDAGLTAWLHRTTMAMVLGQPSPPGRGGNCVDWTFNGNHVADGEYLIVGDGGVITYKLDDDTFFDGVDLTHVVQGDLQCGGEQRALFCCAAP